MRKGLLALPVLVLLAAPASGLPSAQASGQTVLRVPGGAAALAQALGLDEDWPRSRLLLTAIRVLWETPEGTDREFDGRRARVLEHLRGAHAVQAGPGAAQDDTVPGFLSEDAWKVVLREVGAPEARSTFERILGNRTAALLYHGIASLDQSTRDYLVKYPGLVDRLSEAERVSVFATFGRSLRVRDGRVEVPGGPEALPLWKEVVGDVEAPAAFILRVVSRDDGRLALIYDGIAHLEPGAQRFALGMDIPSDKRIERFRKFYDAAGAALRNWQPRRRPFDREPFDAIHLLFSMHFGPQGELTGPTWPGFWNAVLDPYVIPEKGLHPHSLDEDGPLDAARLLELFSVADPVERTRRSERWLFAHRVFGDATPASITSLLWTVKAYSEYPTLLLTLERMGIRTPATYAAAVRAAARLSDADRRLWQFQSALAILERSRAARSIGAKEAEALVLKLSEITPEGGEPYRGAVARWIEEDFLPAVAKPVVPPDMPPESGPVETAILAA
ncbi:MAG: hypothetical protein EHM13_08255, partial [Acidobacteria bacterium]